MASGALYATIHLIIADAQVICRQLGDLDAVSMGLENKFSGASPPHPKYGLMILHVLAMRTILSSATLFGEENCGHHEDSGVECSGLAICPAGMYAVIAGGTSFGKDVNHVQ